MRPIDTRTSADKWREKFQEEAHRANTLEMVLTKLRKLCIMPAGMHVFTAIKNKIDQALEKNDYTK